MEIVLPSKKNVWRGADREVRIEGAAGEAVEEGRCVCLKLAANPTTRAIAGFLFICCSDCSVMKLFGDQISGLAPAARRRGDSSRRASKGCEKSLAAA
ncbi:hypothetical protein V1292_001061 [Bradyrhizobium sp. AZCC 1719]|uniref:hypothetical protein n=1 Tax=Bradyrhizobium sp. AZCC 1719 TaxID=3117028 RepID=UPI002FF02824